MNQECPADRADKSFAEVASPSGTVSDVLHPWVWGRDVLVPRACGLSQESSARLLGRRL